MSIYTAKFKDSKDTSIKNNNILKKIDKNGNNVINVDSTINYVKLAEESNVNDEDINKIESKIQNSTNNDDKDEPFKRENFISLKTFKIPTKKINDELSIMKKDDKKKENLQKQYDEEKKVETEIRKIVKQNDRANLEKYYKGRDKIVKKLKKNKSKRLTKYFLIYIFCFLLFILLILYFEYYK